MMKWPAIRVILWRSFRIVWEWLTGGVVKWLLSSRTGGGGGSEGSGGGESGGGGGGSKCVVNKYNKISNTNYHDN